MARARLVDLREKVKTKHAMPWAVLWSVRHADERKFHEQRFPSKAAAQAFCDEVNAKLARGHMPNIADGRQTFREYADRWLSNLQNVKPRTVAGYESHFRVHVYPVFGDVQLRDIRRSDVEDYVRALRAEGLAPPTIKHAFTPLKRVLKRAVIDEILASNPGEGVVLPTDRSIGRVKPQPTFLTEEQVEQLGRVFDGHPPYGLLIRFVAYTGLRAGEVAGLNVGDVQLGRIHVRRTRTKIKGGWLVDSPKTKGSDRRVPLPRWLQDELAAYLATEHPRGREVSAPLWPGRHRYPALLTEGIWNWDEPWERDIFYKKHFKPALIEAKLPPSLRLHDLRHTYASLCASKGIPAYRLSRYMGHSNVQTTLSIYTHLFRGDEDADMQLLGGDRVVTTRQRTRLSAARGAS